MRISTKTRRFLEIATNLAILVVAIIIVGNFVWSRWKPRPQLESPKVGSRVLLPGIQWDDGNTLVMVLQKGCRYCEESAAFYRKLRDQRSGPQPRMLAAVPGDKADIARYLSEQGVIVRRDHQCIPIGYTRVVHADIASCRSIWKREGSVGGKA